VDDSCASTTAPHNIHPLFLPAPKPDWDDDRYLSGREAEQYLRELGLPTKASTLSKYRCIGGGPEYELFGRFPKYRPPALRKWAFSRLSPPKRSTSDPG
jgi:hypothetical protein